ncbi:hypothetical protein GCM10027610_052420 [Dactylosporangium cerinum]
MGESPTRETRPTVCRTDASAEPLQSVTPSGMASAALRAPEPITWAPFTTKSCPRETADCARGLFSRYFVARSLSFAAPLATCPLALRIIRDRSRPLNRWMSRHASSS